MKQLILAERIGLAAHAVAMAFGLAGLLLVLPHPEFIVTLSELGQTFFRWGMSGGGVVYILLGALAVSIYAYRTLGLGRWLTFLIPSVGLSLTSELLGTSTGFPFGHYEYLSGLGYKISGLVPFTIPLSWFYLGFVSYLLAKSGLEARQGAAVGFWQNLWRQGLAIFLGALLLTSWDFVLDPAMSQTAFPFWHWQQPGAFFGMPYQNFAGWMGTGAVFMTVAALLWTQVKRRPLDASADGHDSSTSKSSSDNLLFPLLVYLSNFAFAAVMSLAAGMVIPVALGVLLGVAPAVALWWMAQSAPTSQISAQDTTAFVSETAAETSVGLVGKVATTPLKVSSKL